MTLGLYVYGESEPRLICGSHETLRKSVASLSPAEREKGWIIKPVTPEWPVGPRPGQNFRSLLATAAGIALLASLCVILLMCAL